MIYGNDHQKTRGRIVAAFAGIGCAIAAFTVLPRIIMAVPGLQGTPSALGALVLYAVLSIVLWRRYGAKTPQGVFGLASIAVIAGIVLLATLTYALIVFLFKH